MSHPPSGSLRPASRACTSMYGQAGTSSHFYKQHTNKSAKRQEDRPIISSTEKAAARTTKSRTIATTRLKSERRRSIPRLSSPKRASVAVEAGDPHYYYPTNQNSAKKKGTQKKQTLQNKKQKNKTESWGIVTYRLQLLWLLLRLWC